MWVWSWGGRSSPDGKGRSFLDWLLHGDLADSPRTGGRPRAFRDTSPPGAWGQSLLDVRGNCDPPSCSGVHHLLHSLFSHCHGERWGEESGRCTVGLAYLLTAGQHLPVAGCQAPPCQPPLSHWTGFRWLPTTPMCMMGYRGDPALPSQHPM